MANYLLKKDCITNSITYMEFDFDGYSFTPKHNEKYLNINKVIIVNPNLIDKVLTFKFNNTFRKLASLIFKIIDGEDSDESSILIALDEISKTRGIILNRYQKFLSLEKEKMFLNKLRYLESELRIKQIEIKEKCKYLEEEKYIGRGR